MAEEKKQINQMGGGEKQTHFVLVHGACHGAWCWYKVATQLKAEGHRVTALDMAAAGVNPKRLDELNSFSDYCQPLMEFMEALLPEEKVVLTGHSLGGISISFAMEKFPDKIAVAVFVTAFMPGPNLSIQATIDEAGELDSLDNEVSAISDGDNKTLISFIFGPKCMSSLLYQLSPPEDLTLATMLVRPIGSFTEEDGFSKESTLTKQNNGSVRRAYVICDRDNVLKQGFQEWLIETNPPDEVTVISGADHMVMFSKPQELCVRLQDLAQKYC